MNKKFCIGIFPCTNDFEFERKKIPVLGFSPSTGDFKFQRKNCYRDFFQVLETLSLNGKDPLYWGNNLLFAP